MRRARLTTLRRAARLGTAAVALLLCAHGSAALAPARQPTAASDPAITEFYRARSGQPLWLAPASGDAAQQLLTLLGTSEVDGIAAGTFQTGALLMAVRQAAAGDAAAVRRAELLLSEAFVAYARALQSDPRVGVIFVDPELKPAPSSAASLLAAAAQSPSLAAHLRQFGWMNPVYGQLRQAALGQPAMTGRERYLLSLNLQRARALPPGPSRYVLVNTANQRLYMWEGGKVVGEMKVVTGRTTAPTPLMNAFIRYAVLNPYWNVPADITARLAPNVLKQGTSYLRKQGYQVVSSFGADLSVIDAASVDWDAVVAGKVAVQMRQLPGPSNSMGRVKFMFPNSQGVWLHDTPSRELFANSERLESSGCVRLEDAWRLGAWLFGRPLTATTKGTERQLELPQPVPVYITYLTAIPGQSAIRFIDDVYRRDPPPDGGQVS